MISGESKTYGEVKKYINRDCYKDVMKFVRGDACYDGRILVLYGLRRTGKTVLMEQVINGLDIPSAYLKVENGDTMDDIVKALIRKKEEGVRNVFIDEITLAEDFITNSSVLPDIFAKEGMRIVVAGTDSLGFLFADNDELFDRTIWVNTTHIPYAEHSRVLGVNDMDDYIKYGGLMRKGACESDRIIRDYESSCRYLDSSVAGNVIRSIKKSPRDSVLDGISTREMETIIHKIVELYSGNISAKQAVKKLSDVSVNYPVKKLVGRVSDDTINMLVSQKKEILSDFAKEINADCEITSEITPAMINELERVLFDMNLLSVTPVVNYRYTDEAGWSSDRDMEYYIVQPAIKYHHLEKAMNFIEDTKYYSMLTRSDRLFMKQKLEEKILGEMTEQIVLFDIKKRLDAERYEVVKPVFYVDGQRKGEYDLLIYDKGKDVHYDFEVKHSETMNEHQDRHLRNAFFEGKVNDEYGTRAGCFVLYRGETSMSMQGTPYINVSDFMRYMDACLERGRDVDGVMQNFRSLCIARMMADEIGNSTHFKFGDALQSIADSMNEEIVRSDHGEVCEPLYDEEEYYEPQTDELDLDDDACL